MSKEQCPYHSVHHFDQKQTPQAYMEEVINHPDFVCIFGKAALRQEHVTFHTIEGSMEATTAASQVCEHLYGYIDDVLKQIDFEQPKLPLASCIVTFPNQHFTDEIEAYQVVSKL